MTICRGDIYYVDWENSIYPVGSEQRPGRPAIIVSNDESNAKLNTVQVVYLTSKDKAPHPAHVSVMCKVQSIALCEQLYTVDKRRLGDYIRSCTAAEMEKIEHGMMEVLGLTGIERVPSKMLEEQLQAAKAYCKELQAINAELMERVKDFEEKERNKGAGVIKLEVERDTYKMLYNNLLDRLYSGNEVGV